MEALLQSTLECFYNQTCLDILQSNISSTHSMNATALDSSLPSQYHPKSRVQEHVDQLMVEQWMKSAAFEKYYAECQPSQCTYSHETKNSAVYIITTIVGLVGGLVTVLKLAAPRLIKLCMSRRKNAQHIPDTGMNESQLHKHLESRKAILFRFLYFVHGKWLSEPFSFSLSNTTLV